MKKKYEILYDWTIAKITFLADSNEAENYVETLDPTTESFTALAEQMRGIGADLAAAKAQRVHFDRWGELRQCLVTFEERFANFPNAELAKFRVSVSLSDKLAQSAETLDANDVDESIFEILEIAESLPLCWFSSENARSISESMAVFSCEDISALEAEIESKNLSPVFIFYMLAALHTMPVLSSGFSVFVKRVNPAIDSSSIVAFVKLVVLSTGKPVHTTRRYQSLPSVLDPDILSVTNSYQQWGDVLNVLSEYNSRDEILIKYLTIYHVVENFMFKRPIVSLEQQQDGRMFSIRDFQRLYKKVDTYESVALKQLFSEVFKLNASAGVTFSNHIASRWASVATSQTEIDINKTLEELGANFQFSNFTAPTAAEQFAKLVYAIRNTIVHNKETEFHLTYASLTSCACALIETFLIPSLEEICFSLISSHNPILWYDNKVLKLY